MELVNLRAGTVRASTFTNSYYEHLSEKILSVKINSECRKHWTVDHVESSQSISLLYRSLVCVSE